MRILILVGLALMLSGCAVHSQASGQPNLMANVWIGADLDGSAERPSFNNDAHFDGAIALRVWPPAFGVGVQLKANAEPPNQ